MKRILGFLLSMFFIFAFLLPQYVSAKELGEAADFKLKDLDGKQVSLSDYKGRQPVMLFFWTTWCPFCRKELKVLNEKHQELSKDGFEVFAVNVAEGASKVGNFIKHYQLTLRVILDIDSSVAESYGIFGVPTYIIIDNKGGIRFKGNSFPEKEYKALVSK